MRNARPAPCTHGDAREVNVNVATGQCCANRERERRRRQIIQRVRRRRWAQRRRSSVRQSNSAGVPRETIDVHVAVETHCCILMTRRCSRASHTPYACRASYSFPRTPPPNRPSTSSDLRWAAAWSRSPRRTTTTGRCAARSPSFSCPSRSERCRKLVKVQSQDSPISVPVCRPRTMVLCGVA